MKYAHLYLFSMLLTGFLASCSTPRKYTMSNEFEIEVPPEVPQGLADFCHGNVTSIPFYFVTGHDPMTAL